MKAIETVYRGYRFRSRLEARWAVFFDAMDIRWEYEREGFEVAPGEYYLPDFYLHIGKEWDVDLSRDEPGHWFEVKPLPPNPKEKRLLESLALNCHWAVYAAVGLPGDSMWLTASSKHALSEVFLGQPVSTLQSLEFLCSRWAPFAVVSKPRIRAAIMASRGARFEHGESSAH